LALNIAVVGSIYRFMTSRPMTWRIVWPGTVFTSLVYTALQFAGTNILTRRMAGATEVYGTFAALIVLAFWISIHGLVALLGAEINATVQRRRHRDRPAEVVAPTALLKEKPPAPVHEPSQT
jgi:membrane protein